MCAYWAILSREALLIWRDRAGLCLLLVVPAVVISIGGFALRALFEGPPVRVRLAVEDEDGGAAARALVERLAEVPLLEVSVSPPRDDREDASRLRIPSGFSAAYEHGAALQLELETDVAARTERAMIRAILSEVRARLAAGRLAARLAGAQILAHTGDLDPAALRRDSLGAVTHAALDEVRLVETITGSDTPALRSFDLQVPGMATMFLLFGALGGVGRRILEDGETGRLRRLLLAPASSTAVLGGLLSARALVGALQMTVLLAFGHVAFGLPLGESLGALVAVVFAMVAAAIGCALLLGSLARTDEQLTMLGVATILTMAALGGCWWPLFLVPPWMQALADLTITKWAMEALTAVLLRGAGLTEVAVPIVVLTTVAVVSFAAGVTVFRRRWAWR